jgi:DNA-binding GntR family transcriptional regulator
MTTTKEGPLQSLTDRRHGYRTLAQKAFVVLHEAILTGRLAPGDRLPIEDIARDLGMSAMPIREAVRQLDMVGLVENIPHRGARVTSISIRDLRGVYDARLALEPLAIRRAAERFTPENAMEATSKLTRLNRLEDAEWAEVLAAHTEFHFALYRAADSVWLDRLIRPLWETSERYRYAAPLSGKLEMRQGEHRAILTACIDHEPEHAARLVHNHLARTANALAKQMNAPQLFPLLRVSSKTRR